MKISEQIKGEIRNIVYTCIVISKTSGVSKGESGVNKISVCRSE